MKRGRPQRATSGRAGAHLRPDRGLLLIAAFKLLKALLLVAGGLAALRLLQADAARSVDQWVAALPLDSQRRLAHRFLVRLTGLPANRLHALGIAFFAYAGLFVVEGIGLWRQRRWAEYLTVIATASFVPLEYRSEQQSAAAATVESVQTQDLWWWFMIGVILLLCGEVWMTRRVVRGR